MTEPRLASHMLVAALVRQTFALGDFAAILRKGDENAGAVLLIGRIKGANPRLFERFPSLDKGLEWQEISTQTIDNEEQIPEYLERRTARDPDIWVIELDVAFDERLSGLLASTA
ncbi:DUF1491 family protein [Sphingorhabdus sp.]|jgi:hypothetical protein|uniref:DUF1491 family protein n=1 Tax=Sphingorhabdus sp. TaxID=1902408 RepID=UPI003BB04391|nr:DUF1491 family protein [Sphingomonadales bacterium]MBK9432161.1 DUF1491 family protein [Sphingomonadales bacterium]MBL0023318.1 DUF1491 family protein [Sphingomonadales bacterium]